MWRYSLLAICLASTVACTPSDQPSATDSSELPSPMEPSDSSIAASDSVDEGPPAELLAYAFDVEPVSVSPGDLLAASFEEMASRGGYYTLSRWVGDRWSDPEFLLESDANGGPPRTVDIAEPRDAYDVRGRGPYGLLLPSLLDDGIWRLCLEGERPARCAQIVVAG